MADLAWEAPFVHAPSLLPGWVRVRVIATADGTALLDDAWRPWLRLHHRGWPRSTGASGAVWVQTDGRLRAKEP